MAKKVLVTGGAGFIGSQVNLMLHEAGYETIVLDNLSRGDSRTVVTGRLIEGDIADEELLNQIFTQEKIDSVMHFAASIEVGESVSNPSLYYQNNVVGTLRLLEAMRKNKINRLVFSSTAAIFGLPMTDKIAENHVCDPINPYGRTKLMIEHILCDYEAAYGIQSCCLRYFNAAGGDPSRRIKSFCKKHTNLIPIALQAIIEEKPVTVFGTDYPTLDGTCIRDYIHIDDLGQAHLLALAQLENTMTSSRFNLGNGSGFSVKEVLETAQEVTGRPLLILSGSRRDGDPPQLVADAALAKKVLGWRPQYSSLKKIIEDAWTAIKK